MVQLHEVRSASRHGFALTLLHSTVASWLWFWFSLDAPGTVWPSVRGLLPARGQSTWFALASLVFGSGPVVFHFSLLFPSEWVVVVKIVHQSNALTLWLRFLHTVGYVVALFYFRFSIAAVCSARLVSQALSIS